MIRSGCRRSRAPPHARQLQALLERGASVETATLADDFLLQVLNGRLRDNVVHFRSVAEAVSAMEAGEVAAVMATRAEIEGAARPTDPRFELTTLRMPELKIQGWPLGMAVKAESTALAEALGKAMAEIERDGTLARIFNDHGVTLRKP